MPPTVPFTPDAFDALLRLNGLAPSPERRARMWAARGIVEAIRGRLARDMPFDAEGALTFLPDRTTPVRRERP